MKKLLSLLSIITISGFVAPTTIAIIYYQKENNNNNNKNFEKTIKLNLTRIKRNGERINIYSHLPGYLNFQGSKGGPTSGNSPDWQEIKWKIVEYSKNLPIDVINRLNYNNLSKESVSVFIPNGEYYLNKNYYYGSRIIKFYYN